MTNALIGSGRAVTQCVQCGEWDDHPKLIDFATGVRHHDCLPNELKLAVIGGESSEHPLVTARIIKACEDGTRGGDLLALIQSAEIRPADHGDAQMNTTGIDTAIANAFNDALYPSTGTATIGAKTITAPVKVRFDSVMTTTDNGASTEWPTAAGYTAGGVSAGTGWAASSGTPALKATNAAVSVTNAPAQTWAGNECWDSSGSPQRLTYAALTGGNKTVNLGDTCTINSGNLSVSTHGS